MLLGDMAAARKSCSLVMFNTKGKPVARYHLENAWPSKIEIGALKAGASRSAHGDGHDRLRASSNECSVTDDDRT